MTKKEIAELEKTVKKIRTMADAPLVLATVTRILEKQRSEKRQEVMELERVLAHVRDALFALYR